MFDNVAHVELCELKSPHIIRLDNSFDDRLENRPCNFSEGEESEGGLYMEDNMYSEFGTEFSEDSLKRIQ